MPTESFPADNLFQGCHKVKITSKHLEQRDRNQEEHEKILLFLEQEFAIQSREKVWKWFYLRKCGNLVIGKLLDEKSCYHQQIFYDMRIKKWCCLLELTRQGCHLVVISFKGYCRKQIIEKKKN